MAKVRPPRASGIRPIQRHVNYARAFVVPLARQPRVIQTAQGAKTIHTTTSGAGFNISPMSPVEIVDTDDLPSELRARLRRLMEAA